MDSIMVELRALNTNQLAHLNDALSRELRRVRRVCEDGADCAACKNAAYCKWLNLAQMCISVVINEKISADS